MDGTEVRVGSCGGEGVGEALPGFQYRRLLKLIVSAHDNVRHVVVVDPGHRSPDWHRECFG